MRWMTRRALNVLVRSVVGAGIAVDHEGRLCLPDGLTPARAWRLIDLLLGESHASPRAALHALFARLGVEPRTTELLEEILREGGDVDLAAAARRAPAVTAALPSLKRIPERFRAFLVDELGVADPGARDLEQATVSTREEAARRIGCAPEWDTILSHPEQVSALAAPWRERAP